MVADLLESIEDALFNLIQQNLQHFGAIRIKLLFFLTLVEVGSGKTKNDVPTSTNWISVGHQSFIEDAIVACASYIITNLNYMCETSSEMSVLRLDKLLFLIGDYLVPTGRFSRHALPVHLKGRKGLLNPQAPFP